MSGDHRGAVLAQPTVRPVTFHSYQPNKTQQKYN
uniref:Uncharacterized protein n=1 Tax=Anguilla anguilla TaxID=7936 RepID=A0A0E9PDU6_ANGAN